MDIQEYLNNQKNLPDFMRDFHGQKNVFKAIYTQWANKEDSHPVLREINWVLAHQFVIDIFLWWMGMHGYKLQKDKSKSVEFLNINQTIDKFNKQRIRDLNNILFSNS